MFFCLQRVNNSNKKDPKILQFLQKFHSNIKTISKGIEDSSNVKKLNALAENMIKEFNIV